MPRNEKWDPMRDLASVQKQMNKLVESAMARTDFQVPGGVGSWEPVADVYETDEALVVTLEIPGLRQEDIDARIDGDDLVIEGERRMDREQPGEHFHRVERSYGRFLRMFRLPPYVDRNSIDARYVDGVLKILLARADGGEQKAIQVSIK